MSYQNVRPLVAVASYEAALTSVSPDWKGVADQLNAALQGVIQPPKLTKTRKTIASFDTTAEGLTRALKVVGRCVERTFIQYPMQEHVLFRGVGNHIEITGTDHDRQVTVRVPMPGTGDWVATAHYRPLAKMLAASRGYINVTAGPEEQRFATVQNQPDMKWTVTPIVFTGSLNVTLTGLNAEEFSVMRPLVGKATVLPVERDNTIEALSFCKAAVSEEATRYYLNGVYAHLNVPIGSGVTFVATDGHRLNKISVAGETASKGKREKASKLTGWIIPREAVDDLLAILPQLTDPTVTMHDAGLTLTGGQITYVAKLIDGAFPDYARVIPDGGTRREVFGSSLADALKKVSSARKPIDSHVQFLFDGEGLELRCTAPGGVTLTERIATAPDQPPLTIGFNAQYLLDAIKCLDKDGAITLRTRSPADPVLITSDKADRLCIVMPLRV